MSRSNDLASLADEATGGISKAEVGLGNVDNTADSAKPVSSAQQTALDAKANKSGDTFTGNVGIGATSPSTKLDFGLTSNGTDLITLRKNSNSKVTLGVNSEYGARIAGPSDANAVVSFGNISISDGSTFNESMRIDQNGKVGIGTISPSANILTGITTGSDSSNIYLGATGTGNAELVLDASNGDFAGSDYYMLRQLNSLDVEHWLGTSGDYIFKTAGGTERMRIKSNGNIGINEDPNRHGYQSGSRVLTVKGNSTDDFGVLELLSPNTTGSNRLGEVRFGNMDNHATAVIATAGIRATRDGADDATALSLWAGGSGGMSQRMTISSIGRVGIGNTQPTNELTIGPDTPGADIGNAIELRGSAGDSSLQRFQIYNNGASGKTEFKLGRAGNSPSTYLTIGPTDVQMGTDLDLGSGSVSVKKTANTSGNYPAIEVYSSGTGDSGAGIAIQQKTSEGDTIIFADYDPYVEWGISSENNANEIHFTAGNSTSSLGSKTFTNNAGSTRTAYKKMIVNLSSGKVSIGGNLAVHDVIQTGNPEDSNSIFRQIVRHTGNSSEAFTISDMGMSDNNTALINISLGTDSTSRHHHNGGCLIYWNQPRGVGSSIQQTIVPAFKGSNVSTFSVSVTVNSLVVTKDSDLNVAVTVIGGGGVANH
tara:strand:+ start:1508 stop:3466 length:1959 start_codon:yes stop_codon:yes gene_type:complete